MNKKQISTEYDIKLFLFVCLLVFLQDQIYLGTYVLQLVLLMCERYQSEHLTVAT